MSVRARERTVRGIKEHLDIRSNLWYSGRSMKRRQKSAAPTYLSYDEWLASGRHVKKGEKSHSSKNGVPVFEHGQTSPLCGPIQNGAKPDHFDDPLLDSTHDPEISHQSDRLGTESDHFFPDYIGDSWGDR